jgi:hypothetical protein
VCQTSNGEFVHSTSSESILSFDVAQGETTSPSPPPPPPSPPPPCVSCSHP